MPDIKMNHSAALSLNSECYCWPVARERIVDKIVAQKACPNMSGKLSERPHYFANTSIFLAPPLLADMTDQIRAIEAVIKRPAYVEAVRRRSAKTDFSRTQSGTMGAFMGYDFHLTADGPRLIEINSNAGGAFIVDMIERAIDVSAGKFPAAVLDMFESEWSRAGHDSPLKTVAIVDTQPEAQYHFPDMCLAKSLLEAQGLEVVIVDPSELRMSGGRLYVQTRPIDLVYNRLTDFDLSDPAHAVLRRAYLENQAVVTPAPHHHALYADKRNLILLSDPKELASYGATEREIDVLRSLPKTIAVTPDKAEWLWTQRRNWFFKPSGGFGSRGAFRGAKLTKRVWGEIISGGYVAQALVSPPIRAVTVDGQKTALKFDLRVYSYYGEPLLYAARIYQGQTTNLRTAGGGLAAVIPVADNAVCK